MNSIESIAREFIEEGYNKKNFEKAVFERFSKKVIFSDINGKLVGADAMRSVFLSWYKAFPDIKMKISEIVKYESTVVISNMASGTHQNKFFLKKEAQSDFFWFSDFSRQFTHLSPKGKSYRVANDLVFVFSNKKIQRVMFVNPDLSYYRQLSMNFSLEVTKKENKRSLIDRLRQIGRPPFTEKETVCLALTFSGLSAKQIGAITKNSHRTIETHMKNAMYKASCFSKLCLVEKMIANETLPLWSDLCHIVLGFLENKALIKSK